MMMMFAVGDLQKLLLWTGEGSEGAAAAVNHRDIRCVASSVLHLMLS